MMYMLSLLNTVLDILNTLYESGKKALTAAVDSQKPDIWVFLQENAVPWITKSDVHGVLSFSTTTKVFYNTWALENPIKRGLEDVVTAEIIDSNNDIVIDATETFHSLRWSSVPSVYEIILVLFLSNDYLLSEEKIRSYSIRLMTLDQPNLIIPLTHSKIKDRFTSWAEFEG